MMLSGTSTDGCVYGAKKKKEIEAVQKRLLQKAKDEDEVDMT